MKSVKKNLISKWFLIGAPNLYLHPGSARHRAGTILILVTDIQQSTWLNTPAKHKQLYDILGNISYTKIE